MEAACLERQRDNLLYRVHLWRLQSGWRKFGFGAVRSGVTVDAGDLMMLKRNVSCSDSDVRKYYRRHQWPGNDSTVNFS